MIKKRRALRKATSIDIEFEAIELEFGHVKRVLGKGTIVDISKKGFCMVTGYPVQRGHVITIKNGGKGETPDFGLAKWIRNQNGFYRAGFSYKFQNDT